MAQKKVTFPFALLAALAVFVPSVAHAQETVLGHIVQVVAERNEEVEGTGITAVVQDLLVDISEGAFKDQRVTVENDVMPLRSGDRVYLTLEEGADGKPTMLGIGLADPYRLPAIGILALVFVVLIVLAGGIQGIRGLASLAGSLILILYVLLPSLARGWSPIGTSMAVASLIIIVGSFVTHGFNRTTSSAVVGMVITVLITGALALWGVHAAFLSGMNSEEAFFLFQQTTGTIDLGSLLLGGILIGLLGVLYDSAIGQAIAVEELRRASPAMTPRKLIERGLRIGREHIGALVNTLAIAYVGASLPLLLLIRDQHAHFLQTINQEIIATEIVRILIGSIGLLLAVPVTTFVAVFMLRSVTFTGSGTPNAHSHSS